MLYKIPNIKDPVPFLVDTVIRALETDAANAPRGLDDESRITALILRASEMDSNRLGAYAMRHQTLPILTLSIVIL